MLDTNKVFITGRLGKDPKSGDTKNGKKWAAVSLATSKLVKENEFVTVWNKIVAFGKAGEVLAGCRKGDMIYVDGELNNNNYTNKDGVKIYEVQVVARGILKGSDAKAEAAMADAGFAGDANEDIGF